MSCVMFWILWDNGTKYFPEYHHWINHDIIDIITSYIKYIPLDMGQKSSSQSLKYWEAYMPNSAWKCHRVSMVITSMILPSTVWYLYSSIFKILMETTVTHMYYWHPIVCGWGILWWYWSCYDQFNGDWSTGLPISEALLKAST